MTKRLLLLVLGIVFIVYALFQLLLVSSWASTQNMPIVSMYYTFFIPLIVIAVILIVGSEREKPNQSGATPRKRTKGKRR